MRCRGGHAGGGQIGDAPLAAGEGVDAGDCGAAWASAHGDEFASSALQRAGRRRCGPPDHTINEGQLDSIKELSKTFTDLVEASDTGLIAFHFYMSADGTEVSNIQVHTDAGSMDAYLPLVREKISEALDLSETSSIDVYGTPGPVVREVLRQNEAQGVRVRVTPNHLDGFTRPPVA